MTTRTAALAVCLAALSPAAAQQLDDRPIRGAWHRPTTNIATTELLLDRFADAGGTDLFLESFWWGKTTGVSDIFPEHFSFDVLADTMDRAHKRGIRTHAWIEAAYFSFGNSGQAILDANPGWKVVDDEGNTDIGDIDGQVFVNLGHPGVQQILADLCTELSTNYPMLWGINTDYHRFPLDNDDDAGEPQVQFAPYSFDTWSRETFEAEFGADPLFAARYSSDPLYDEFVDWRREQIALAAKAMNDAIAAADPGNIFSGAVFGTAIADRFCNGNIAEFEKMQDWPRMAANGWLPLVVPMSYGSSTSAIRNDLRAVNRQIENPCGTSGNTTPNARLAAGLAIINPQSRPGVVPQLNTVYAEGIGSFVWFKLDALVTTQNVADMNAFLLSNGPFQSADFNRDLRIDAQDWDTFFSAFTGTPFQSSGPLDLTGDNRVNFDDQNEFLRQFRAFRFGADGVLAEDEFRALLAAFTDPSESWPLHLFDLTGDAIVDCQDVQRARTILSASLPYDLNPDLDASGVIDGADVTAFVADNDGQSDAADLTADGINDFTDTAAFLNAITDACP